MAGTLPSRAVRNHSTLLWTLIAFLGGWFLFGALRRATEGEGTAVSLLVQVAALAVVIGVMVLVARRLR
jgi:membrane protein DedA with SNARE-associated domain